MANRDVEPAARGGYSAKSSVLSVHRVTLSASGSSGAGGSAERLHPTATIAMSRVESREPVNESLATASERSERATRAERGTRGPRERACKGVRGTKSPGESRNLRATMCLPLLAPTRSVPNEHRAATRCCASSLVRQYE